MRRAPNIDPDPHARAGVGTEQPLTKYPDEPHPDNEHEWKAWWVKKCFDLQKPMTEGDIVFVDQCWKETKARWNIKPWVDYQPHRQRDKRFYDIKLRDGTIVEACWPNGVHFTPFGFKPVPKKAGRPPYPDYRVLQIRECDNPEA